MHQYRVRKQQEEWLPIARQNLEDFNETTVNCHDVGSMDNICSACGALMFKDEKHVGKLSSHHSKTLPIEKPSDRQYTKTQTIP